MINFLSFYIFSLWLSLLFGTWSPRKLKVFYRKRADGRHGMGLSVPGRLHRDLLGYSRTQYAIILSSLWLLQGLLLDILEIIIHLRPETQSLLLSVVFLLSQGNAKSDNIYIMTSLEIQYFHSTTWHLVSLLYFRYQAASFLSYMMLIWACTALFFAKGSQEISTQILSFLSGKQPPLEYSSLLSSASSSVLELWSSPPELRGNSTVRLELTLPVQKQNMDRELEWSMRRYALWSFFLSVTAVCITKYWKTFISYFLSHIFCPDLWFLDN